MCSIARAVRVLRLLRRFLACWQGLRAGRRRGCSWSFRRAAVCEGKLSRDETRKVRSERVRADSAMPATCHSGSDWRPIMANIKRLDELAGIGRDFVGLQFRLTPDELMHSIDLLRVLGYCFGVLDAVRQKAQLGDAVEGLSCRCRFLPADVGRGQRSRYNAASTQSSGGAALRAGLSARRRGYVRLVRRYDTVAEEVIRVFQPLAIKTLRPQEMIRRVQSEQPSFTAWQRIASQANRNARMVHRLHKTGLRQACLHVEDQEQS
jgi:hypothetical protein